MTLNKTAGSSKQSDGTGVLTCLLRFNFTSKLLGVGDSLSGCGEHWKSITVLSLFGCGLSVSLSNVEGKLVFLA